MQRLTTEEARQALRASAAWCLRHSGGFVAHNHTVAVIEQLARVMSGDVKRLIITMPPRHGKSTLVALCVALWLRVDPKARFGLASFGAVLARKLSRMVRRFHRTLGGKRGGIDQMMEWETDQGGGMWAAGSGGPITGSGATGALIADDIVRGIKDADSELLQERTRDWYRAVFRTRSEAGAAIVAIGTRWSEADFLGDLVATEETAETPEGWTILLIDCEYDPKTLEELRERLPNNEVIGLEREPGDRLKMLPEVEYKQLKSTLGSRHWSTLFQCRAVPREGGMFRVDRIKVVKRQVYDGPMVRAWDFASTDDQKADQTVGCLMAMTGTGDERRWHILDCVFGRHGPADTRELVVSTARQDYALYDGRVVQYYEQEPGSAGKMLVDQFIAEVAPSAGDSNRPTGSKEVRAMAFAAQVERGAVDAAVGEYVAGMLGELRIFPGGRHDDFVDASASAFNWLALEADDPGWELYEGVESW